MVIQADGMRPIVNYMFLTFSHSEPRAQLVRLMSGANVFMSSYVLDGGELEYERRAEDENRVGIGDDFRVEMTAGLSAAGLVEYSMGAQ